MSGRMMARWFADGNLGRQMGVKFAQPAHMDSPDSRRGRAPEIRLDEDNIAFHLKIDLPRGVKGQLLLRCERDGQIYASIVSAVQRERR